MEISQHIERHKALDELLAKTAKLRRELNREANDYYFIFNRDMRYIYSGYLDKRSAISAPNMIGGHWFELGFASEIMEPLEKEIKQVFQTGHGVQGQLRGSLPDLPDCRCFEYVLEPLYTHGVVEAVVCKVKDITEQALNLTTKDILDSITDGVSVVDSNWCFTYLNQEARHILNTCVNGELLHKNIWEVFIPLAEYRQRFFQAKIQNTAVCVEVFSGVIGKWLEIQAYPLREGVSFYFRDIEKRKRMEAAFLIREQQYKALVENIPCAIARVDREFRYLYVNPTMERFFGIITKAYIGGTWQEAVRDENYSAEWKKHLEAVFATGLLIQVNTKILRDGEMNCYSSYFVPEFGPNGITETVLGIFIDITEQKRLEKELCRREQEFKTIVENFPSIIIRYGTEELRYAYVNPALSSICGISTDNLIGKTPCELGDAEVFDAVWHMKCLEVFQTGVTAEVDVEFKGIDGPRYGQASVVPEFSGTGKVQSVLAIIRDVTERRRLETEMARFERLNLIGEIAASIGHEVRNPMTTVRGFLQMFQENTSQSRHREKFALMIEELDRANAIITEFLTLSKNKWVELRPGNINKIFDALFPLIQADALRLGHSIWIEKNDVPDILLNENEIKQLLLNLVRNGLEAMDSGGMVIIKTQVLGTNVCLSVQDRGIGIPSGLLEKIGTPFVTTKDSGTGLGLAVCYRIAERHKAKVEIKTSPEGTTVVVLFKPITG